MRKSLYAIVFALLTLPVSAGAEYLEGVEYQAIKPQPVETGSKIEVREFFWYGCPHCYVLEPFLEKWQQTMPRNARFIRTPGVFNERWAVHARAYYAFEELGLTAKMHRALFDALHKDKQPLFDIESIAAFVASKGGDRKAFVDSVGSFSVDASVNRATQMARAYGLESVPTLIVDGRYMTNANIAGGYDKVPALLDFLIKKAARERNRRK